MTDDRSTTTGEADEARLDHLPEHERDDERTVGGGVLSQGGTAIDTGTGTLSEAGDSTASAATDESGLDTAEEPDTLGIPLPTHRTG